MTIPDKQLHRVIRVGGKDPMPCGSERLPGGLPEETVPDFHSGLCVGACQIGLRVGPVSHDLTDGRELLAEDLAEEGREFPGGQFDFLYLHQHVWLWL